MQCWTGMRAVGLGLGAVVVVGCATVPTDEALALPEIRTHARNQVPACVTPQRLMRYLNTGNNRLSPQFMNIAQHYKDHGDRLKVRWDYAFFQMILETNYLKFKNGAGQGDVNPRQNNFAGIGTTGGGVPGDQFPDVSTGVLAQMQHLIAYSGERVDNPVGRRTREKQDDIIQKSKALGRPVRFSDLTRRWAVDRRYGTSIEFVASRFRAAHCNGRQEQDEVPVAAAPVAAAPAEAPKQTAAVKDEPRRDRKGNRGTRERDDRPEIAAAPRPTPETGREIATRNVAEEREASGPRVGLGMPQGPSEPAVRATSCRVLTASYGGQKNILIRHQVGTEMQYTAVQVLDGMEQTLAESFLRTHAKGGELVAEYPTRDAALVKAFHLCPTGRPAR